MRPLDRRSIILVRLVSGGLPVKLAQENFSKLGRCLASGVGPTGVALSDKSFESFNRNHHH